MDTSELKVQYMDSNHSDYLPNLIQSCNSETTDTCRTKLCESHNSTPGSICGPFDCSTPNRGITKLLQDPNMSPIGKMTNKYMYCHLQVSKTIKGDKDTTMKRNILDISTSSVHSTPRKRIKEEPKMPALKSTKKGSVTKKQGVKGKQMSGCVAEVKDDKILPIPSEYDSVLNKIVKEYSLHSKSKGATSTYSDTEEKIFGHTEKVKCE